MNAEIENLLDQLTAIQQDAPGLIAPLTPKQSAWRPEPHRWSVGDCFAHLNTIAEATLPLLDRAIEHGRAHGLSGSGPFGYSWFDRMFVQSMEPPPRMRSRTTRRFAPPAAKHDPATLLAEFMTWQDRLAAVIRRADGLDLRRIRMRVAGPFLAALQPWRGVRHRARARAPSSLAGPANTNGAGIPAGGAGILGAVRVKRALLTAPRHRPRGACRR